MSKCPKCGQQLKIVKARGATAIFSSPTWEADGKGRLQRTDPPPALNEKFEQFKVRILQSGVFGGLLSGSSFLLFRNTDFSLALGVTTTLGIFGTSLLGEEPWRWIALYLDKTGDKRFDIQDLKAIFDRENNNKPGRTVINAGKSRNLTDAEKRREALIRFAEIAWFKQARGMGIGQKEFRGRVLKHGYKGDATHADFVRDLIDAGCAQRNPNGSWELLESPEEIEARIAVWED